jgi:hypothetical protein
MSSSFPDLTLRGALSLGLKQVWPGSFLVRRRPHGFGVTFTHRALPGSITLNIADDDLRSKPEISAKDLARRAWAYLLAPAQQSETLGGIAFRTRSSTARLLS